MKYRIILMAFSLAILANHAAANDNNEIQYDEFGVNTSHESSENDSSKYEIQNNDDDIIGEIESIGQQIVQLGNSAVEASNLIPPMGDISTLEKIQAEREKRKELANNTTIISKKDELTRLSLDITGKIDSITIKVSERISELEQIQNSENRITTLNGSLQELTEALSTVDKFIYLKLEKIGDPDSLRNAESKIHSEAYENNKAKVVAAGIEAEKRNIEENRRKVESLRSNANLNEEEYVIPIFSCRAKDAIWCFSTSHKIYAITAYVSTDDTKTKNAAVYSEVGQGEVQDYTKESASAVDTFGWIENIAISGTRGLPHVYMARDRR